MGVALAAAAWRRGAAVTLIAGPLEVPHRRAQRLVRVESTEEMANAVRAAAASADVLMMAAAPADFRAAAPAAAKIKKGHEPPSIELAPTHRHSSATARHSCARAPCALGSRSKRKAASRTHAGSSKAKSLDLIVLNSALEPGAGIGGDTNRVTILARNGSAEEIPMMLKREIAESSSTACSTA